MKFYEAIVVSIFFFSAVILDASAQEENPTTTSTSTSECVTQCLEQNRVCISEGINHGVCGPCVEGYVEFGRLVKNVEVPKCIEIDSLTWEQFINEYQPTYKPNSTVTIQQRLTLLKQAAIFISQSNRQLRQQQQTIRNTNNSTNMTTTSSDQQVLGLTPFSVDTELEYVERSGYFYVPSEDVVTEDTPITDYVPPTIASADLPDSVDWVTKGGVTSVKNQGRCGSCWAVSICGAVEGAAYAKHEYLQSMSFQQFVSCNERNLGCDGGNLIIASLYATITNFGGVSRLNDYEYTDFYGSTTDECLLNQQTTPVAVQVSKPQIVAGMTSGLSYDERSEIFKQVLEQQPIAMVMKSACRTLSNYRRGVLTDDGDCACNSPECLDHAVLMVGYDDTADIPYWKIKNSWGTGWGEDGYFRVAQSAVGDYGLFGVLAEGTIVQAQNVTIQVADEAQDVPLPLWAIIVIAAGSVLLCMCLCIVCRWMRSGSKDYVPEERQPPEQQRQLYY